MRTPYHGALEPFHLRSNTIMFHDWRYVYHGSPGWRTEDGRSLGLWSSEAVPQLRWCGADIPKGIRLRAAKGVKSGPIIVPDRPWEGIIFAPSLIRAEGRYRLWYEVVSPEQIEEGNPGHANHLCYAESHDGIEWGKPSLGIVDYGGSTENNIVYGGSSTPWGYHGGCVFLDPKGPREERYKAIHLGFLPDEEYDRIREQFPEADPLSERRGRHSVVFGATSPDGLHWGSLRDPLLLQSSDTQNTAYFDEFLGKYVAYLRTWVIQRRSVGRAESQDFRRFDLPETVLWPGQGVGPSDLWYSNAKTVYPGAPDYHLMFPKRWKVSEDRFYVHLATSPDGIMWGMPPESEVLTPGEGDDWDAGGVDVGCGMVEMGDDRVGVPFVGYRIPHKYTRSVPLGKIGLASWEKGRLVALEAEEEGEFRTMYVTFKGDSLRINVRTTAVGEVRVGVLGPKGKAIEGRDCVDCDPMTGNFLDRPVTWQGEAGILAPPGQQVAFRFRMRQAEIFSLSVR